MNTNLEAPTDLGVGEVAPEPKKVPQRGVRRRVLGEGEGDYCVYEIVGPGTKLPQGALLPLPKIPRFESTQEALRWIRNDSGDLLANKQVMVFRACEVLSLTVQQKPVVVISAKPKRTMNEPKAAAPETSDG